MGYVVYIGAANVDITGFATGDLIPRNSNPGKIRLYSGGGARNSAECYARLGGEVKFIGAIGDDAFGQKLVQDSQAVGIDMSHCLTVPGAMSSAYIALMDEERDMAVALSDVELEQRLTPEFMAAKLPVLCGARAVVLGSGLPMETLEFVTQNCLVPLWIDTSSVSRGLAIKPILGRFHTVKCNLLEAMAVTGETAQDIAALQRMARAILAMGCRRVLITCGARGAFCADGESTGMHPAIPVRRVQSATGAGDSFFAGVLLWRERGYSIQQSVRFGMAVANLTIRSPLPVNPDLNLEEVLALAF